LLLLLLLLLINLNQGEIETPVQFRARNSGAIPAGSRICAARSQKRSQNLTGHAQHLN
jgi:hypothetical protein